MAWKKLGRIYNPEKIEHVLGGYGANPVALPLDGSNILRIYFNVRDERNRAHVTYLDYDMEKLEIASCNGEIILAPGEKGTFDDCGCSIGSMLDMGDEIYLYYLGWNLPRNLPFMNRIGLASIDKKTGKCQRVSPAPIMGQSIEDPYSISYPFVMRDGNKYRIWYGSHTSWRNTTPEKYGFNHILKYAESDDGVHIHRDNVICVQGDGIAEYAFSRPSLLYEDGIYKMWYTFRGEKYRIGYAESRDGINFVRKDEQVDLVPSGDGWESDEVSYPYVFNYKGKHYMLYCGNAYGKTGFGLAVEE